MAKSSNGGVDQFIERWQSASGSERANYQLFAHELCTLLERLVALNAERAAEEQRGLIRWLRPEFQIPASGQPQTQPAEQLEIETREEVAIAAKPGVRRPWPATLPAQVKAVAEVMTAARATLTDGAIAACFTGRGAWKKRLPQIIDTLVAVGRVRRRKDGLAVIA